jgi:hypothetical protein
MFEFIVMNFYLYLAILFVFILFYLLSTVSVSPALINSPRSKFSDMQFFSYLRVQDLQKQKNQKASVRVWLKK